ncbi:hypothetical protein B566_EDAN008925 [Ephemera danica]|nr:hypothetical protein B566_EDAN008925 [Ephemera danica]
MADYDNSRASPLSDIPSENGIGGGNTLEKALIKRNVTIRNHNGNFRAAYVPVSEHADDGVPKTGELRGRKTYAFWTLVLLLLLLAAGNLLLTFTVLGVLRLGQGMESIEFVPEQSLIKFYGRTDLDEVIKRDGHLEGFRDSPVSITADNAEARITVLRHREPETGPRILVKPDGIAEVLNVNGFDIKDERGNDVFSTSYPNFGLPRGVRRLDVQAARVSRVSSPISSSLSLSSDSYVTLRGNEGTQIEGMEVVWSADQDLSLRSVNGSIVLGGQQGVALDVQGLHLARDKIVLPATGKILLHQYKLCVCVTRDTKGIKEPSGRLFRVKLPDTCLGFPGRPDPCAV